MKTTHGSILQEWGLPNEGPWRISLVKHVGHGTDLDRNTTVTKQSPHKILQSKAPPASNSINSVYDLQNKPELIRYYHAAAGFPTKTTWLAMIRNKQYVAWQ